MDDVVNRLSLEVRQLRQKVLDLEGKANTNAPAHGSASSTLSSSFIPFKAPTSSTPSTSFPTFGSAPTQPSSLGSQPPSPLSALPPRLPGPFPGLPLHGVSAPGLGAESRSSMAPAHPPPPPAHLPPPPAPSGFQFRVPAGGQHPQQGSTGGSLGGVVRLPSKGKGKAKPPSLVQFGMKAADRGVKVVPTLLYDRHEIPVGAAGHLGAAFKAMFGDGEGYMFRQPTKDQVQMGSVNSAHAVLTTMSGPEVLHTILKSMHRFRGVHLDFDAYGKLSQLSISWMYMDDYGLLRKVFPLQDDVPLAVDIGSKFRYHKDVYLVGDFGERLRKDFEVELMCKWYSKQMGHSYLSAGPDDLQDGTTVQVIFSNGVLDSINQFAFTGFISNDCDPPVPLAEAEQSPSRSVQDPLWEINHDAGGGRDVGPSDNPWWSYMDGLPPMRPREAVGAGGQEAEKEDGKRKRRIHIKWAEPLSEFSTAKSSTTGMKGKDKETERGKVEKTEKSKGKDKGKGQDKGKGKAVEIDSCQTSDTGSGSKVVVKREMTDDDYGFQHCVPSPSVTVT
ncbi:hypothetical protein IAT38_003280 [Cryptococcus sp. DSM 104549]